MTPARLRRTMNLWPPYLAAGIKVLDIADDWTSASVRMRVRRFNANYFGTAFGGSLSSMSDPRSEEHTSELQSLMRISYAVFCLKKKNRITIHNYTTTRKIH